MVDDFEWRIFPCMNPDGYAYSMSVDKKWKKNRSKRPKDPMKPDDNCTGVDLNRNFNTSYFCGICFFSALSRIRERFHWRNFSAEE
jgi:murein tripeptide amidase MpaA